jgi:hypothetical protein
MLNKIKKFIFEAAELEMKARGFGLDKKVDENSDEYIDYFG